MAPDAGRLVLSPGAATDETDPGGRLLLRHRAGSGCQLCHGGPDAADLRQPGRTGYLVGLGLCSAVPTMSRVTKSASVGAGASVANIHVGPAREPESARRDLMDICLQQFQARLNEIQGVAACNARHVLPARCAHWLLRLHAYLGDALPVTHEFLASVLGVRRAGVTVTLQGLQRRGAIRQQRGSIVITDLDQLKQTACSCAIAVKAPPGPSRPKRNPLRSRLRRPSSASIRRRAAGMDHGGRPASAR